MVTVFQFILKCWNQRLFCLVNNKQITCIIIAKYTTDVYNVRRGITMTVSELKRLLKKHGCYFVEHGGKHDKWYSPIINKYFRIPRHASEIKTGTVEAILKQSGIK